MAMPVETSLPRKPRSILVRGVYLLLGLICLAFAAISFIPGIPTFDFVILAAFFFARSSDRMHNWLVNHRYFGRMVGAYRGGLTVRMKWWAASAITLSLGISAIILIDNTVVRFILAAVWVYAIWFVFSRPTKTITRGDDPLTVPPEAEPNGGKVPAGPKGPGG